MGSARTRRGIRDYSSRFSLITAAITPHTSYDRSSEGHPTHGYNRWVQKRKKADKTGELDEFSNSIN